MEDLATLVHRIQDLDREFEDTYIRIVSWSATTDPEQAEIGVEVAGDFTRYPRERWRVLASAVLEWECHAQWPAGFGAHDPLVHSTEHPLLWLVSADQGALYFRGHSDNATQVAADLEQRHQRETEGWLPMSRLTNCAFGGSIADLLAGGYGELASGPSSLLAAYADVIERAGFQASIVRSAGADDQPSGAQRPSVLTFGAPSYLGQYAYIIATGFSCERFE